MTKIYLISALDKEILIDTENIVYKIGITKQSHNKRLKQLQTGTDKKLRIVKEFNSNFPFKVERNLHHYFKNKKINREWFKLSKEDIDLFIFLCEKFETNFKLLESNNNPFL